VSTAAGDPPRPGWFTRLVGEIGPPAPPIAATESIPGRRAFFETAGLRIEPPAHLEVRTALALRERRGALLTAELIRPRERAAGLPLVVYLHGGAWSVWGAADARRITFAIAERGAAVLSVDYGLAPELPFPCAVEDAIYATRWAVVHADDLGGDPERLALGGDSSGANLAAAAILALGGDEPPAAGDLAGARVRVAATLLHCGVFDFAARLAERPTSPGTTEVMSNLAYLGTHFLAHHADPRVSPARAGGLERFPPSYLCCGDQDSALPQTLLMARALAEAGASVTVAVTPGADHEFLLMDAAAHPWVARELARACDWLLAQLA
jgi:acetyl esterase